MFVVIVSSVSNDSIPTLNPKGFFEFSATRAKKQFIVGAKEMMTNWFRAHPDKPARVIADVSTVTLLPPSLVNEMRNDERLSFQAFHANLPGFEGFREGFRDSQVVQTVIIKDLTKLLNKITEPLTQETALTLPELFGDNPDWVEIPLREVVLRLVARISSRVFLGTELCRNEEWLTVTREYTITAFAAAEALRLWPEQTRFFVHWFIPECRKSRSLVKEARRIIEPVIEERRRQKSQGVTDFDDAVEWMEKESKGSYYDPVIAQLLLSVVAIHTTTDQICQTLADLTRHPEMFEPLRNEIITEIGEGGWKKTTLYNMKLLDSVLKESQRLKPNTMVAVSAHSMWDSQVYENPDAWDGYRFLKMRETPGKENQAQFVATSPNHLGFGHGQHACPGRFFASNELKIALCHLLMKYDWRLPEGADPKIRTFGFSMLADPKMKMELRRRQEEIPI
ncbi:cytochrome P450 [Thozetella sp. PMI_491]|nr:cytochrome P450 [Thozetella sp. PMI_491]